MPRAVRLPSATPRRVALLIATRKGLWTLTSDASRRRGSWRRRASSATSCTTRWSIRATARRCSPPRAPATSARRCSDRRTAAARGRKRHAAAFAPDSGRVVDHTFWLTPGHASQPGVWYAGTSPQGLFRTDDGGATWKGVEGFNAHPQRKAWCGGDQDGTPDGPKMHSIIVDPRDPRTCTSPCRAAACSSRPTPAATGSRSTRAWRADFLPEPEPEYGHDPHCVRLPSNPDRLYQQNHCGIYRLDRPATRWVRIGENMPKSVGDIGLPMVAHPAIPNTRVGLSDGRHRRVAAHLARRQARGVSHPRRRQDVEAPGRRACRSRRRGSPSSARPWRSTAARSRACISARRRARSGAAATRAATGGCSRAHLPEIYAVEAGVA